MAASIYATPPPDLSSEDTALSDVSNSSTLNTNRNNHTSGSNSNNPHEAAGATPTATSATTRGATGAGGVESTSPADHLVPAWSWELEPKPAGSGSQ
ncbi:GM25698 [Drosophila sechellia]|uniref:GM25698 n=1 Tax=Drosophila sechellia TaxID=7238 RepID=B4HKS6_DROSE|nr:GM25698 [Drosophila sechellia]